MHSLLFLRALYFLAALYDGFLGLAFIFAAPALFTLTGITPPNHWGYVHFSAATLVIFSWMFLQIALKPIANRNLVIYGVLLKASYVTTVVWHACHDGIPVLWCWFAVADFVFLVLFLWSWRRLHSSTVADS